MILCRNCGKEVTEELHLRIEVWNKGILVKHLGGFCNYKCHDEWKIPEDLNV